MTTTNKIDKLMRQIKKLKGNELREIHHRIWDIIIQRNDRQTRILFERLRRTI